MERDVRSYSSTGLVLPLFAVSCSIVSLFLLLSSGFGTRLDLWPFRTGLTILRAAAYIGLGCALLSLVTGVISVRKRLHAGVLWSLVALLFAIFALGVPYSWKLKAQSYPRIHDISTDVGNPPKFVAVAPLRPGRIEHGGAAVAALQQRAYPDLKTLVLLVPKDQAFRSALETAREMGWQIVAAVPAEGRIEATGTTFWFGFKDDIVIRITPAADHSLLDIRSASRVGVSDVGTNAKRIRRYLEKVSKRAK